MSRILRENRHRIGGFAWGIAMAGFVIYRPSMIYLVCGPGIGIALFARPFTLETSRGRQWWAALVSLYLSVYAVSRFAPGHHYLPLILTTLACGIFGSYVSWLRWQPMPNADGLTNEGHLP
jgi:uncharacterized membrane protein (UPF0136 family)